MGGSDCPKEANSNMERAGALDFIYTPADSEEPHPRGNNALNPWKIKSNINQWETSTKNTIITIQKGGTTEGLEMSKEHFGLVANTTNQLARLGIGSGHTLINIDGSLISNISALQQTNSNMSKHLSKLNAGSKLTFTPPTHCDDWLPFVDGHNWLRLFTDGGQSIPDSPQGVAVCGYAILAGPFKNHNPSTISDSDGTLIYKGGAFLGMGNVLTNNDAEYAGLYLGLKKCLELGTNRVHHLSDSGMVIGIENGNTPRQENIRRAHRRTGLLKQVIYGSDGDIVHTHIYRNRNEIADAEGHIAEDKKPPPCHRIIQTHKNQAPTLSGDGPAF